MPKYISDRKRKLDLGINSYTEGSDVLSITGTTKLSGIVTAITGVAVTYYGDGSNLSGIDLGVGINTAGGNVGYGVTLLDFRGAGVSTITAPVSGISTINITGGAGGGNLDIAGDSGTGVVDLNSQSLTIAGTTNEIETSASNQTITIGLPNDVTVSNDLTVTGNLNDATIDCGSF